MSAVRVAAIIPARMASTRFPGKPLLRIGELPLVEHVRRRALLCGEFSDVVVATCDEEIAWVVERYGGYCIMTAPTHLAATDRVAEAAQHLACTHVVNVQGDELLVLSSDLKRMVRAIEAEPDIPAWNAVTRIERRDELSDRAVVKCVVSVTGRILCCARDFSSLAEKLCTGYEPIRKILGILGYSRGFLSRYASLARTPLEVAEAVDQSRILEHDVMLRGVEFSQGHPGINEPHEVERLTQVLKEDPAQQALLQEILRA